VRPTTTTLRVATANAASGGDQHTGCPAFASWTTSAVKLDVDVLAVQEVDHLLDRSGRVDQVAEIAAAHERTGGPWTGRFAAAVHGTPGSRRTMRPARSTEPGRPSYGVALVSRYPVREWHELRMGPSRARLPVPLPPGAAQRLLWAPDEQRVALAGLVSAPGCDVTVVCTHLSFFPPRAVRQLRELTAWARSLPRPLILLGDLNLPGRVPARVTGWSPLARAPTYPASGPRLQLDHVLLDPGGRTVTVRAAAARPVASSDHLALRVEVAVDGAVGLGE